MSIDAVIFDFNGVLVDDESVHFALFSEILAKEGVNLSQKEYRGALSRAMTTASVSRGFSSIRKGPSILHTSIG